MLSPTQWAPSPAASPPAASPPLTPAAAMESDSSPALLAAANSGDLTRAAEAALEGTASPPVSPPGSPGRRLVGQAQLPITSGAVRALQRATGLGTDDAELLLLEHNGSGQRALAAHLARIWPVVTTAHGAVFGATAAPPPEDGPLRLRGMENAGNR